MGLWLDACGKQAQDIFTFHSLTLLFPFNTHSDSMRIAKSKRQL